jgi:flavodoxin
MTTAVIVYRSATGTTRRLAEEIGAHLEFRGLEVTVQSVGECDPASLAGADTVLLGCWTSGLLVVAQHPDEPWLAFVRDLPALGEARVGLFTTYKIATGSMFNRMRAALGSRVARVDLELKSRDGHLPRDGRAALDRFIGATQP